MGRGLARCVEGTARVSEGRAMWVEVWWARRHVGRVGVGGECVEDALCSCMLAGSRMQWWRGVGVVVEACSVEKG